MATESDGTVLVKIPLERIGHVAVCTDKYMIVWGGYNDDFNPAYAEKYLPANELWIYNTEFKVCFTMKRDCNRKGENAMDQTRIQTQVWYIVRCNFHPMAASGSTVCVGDGNMYLFGGHARCGNVNEFFQLNLNTLVWKRIVPQDKTDKLTPSPRDKAVSWYHEKKFYTFGGFGVPLQGYLGESESFFEDEVPERRGWNNQLCVFDFTTMEWSIPETTGSKPSARAAHTAVRFNNKVYIFGGRHLNCRLNDVHCLDLNSLSWSGGLCINGPEPEGRSWHTASALSHNRMFVYGGFTTSCHPLSDSWLLDTNNLQWTQLTHFPNNWCRLWHTACVTGDQDVLIYGGCEKNILDYDNISIEPLGQFQPNLAQIILGKLRMTF
ncbi:kelch domain-containing protein 2-like isoform X3 [Ostrea edulis]|uniref:kelch domain-containing protein 2-like isoform X3 n=1 Tax=Ostrea edulis TaxID=37623 RepID=UPI0024AECAFD|nr:kelch domain-containing protein 2-like isoform X3 [Ostrea edulis]